MEKAELQKKFNEYQYLVDKNIKYYFQDCPNLDDIKQTGYLSIYDGLLSYNGIKPIEGYLDDYIFLKMSDVADFDTIIRMPEDLKQAIIINEVNQEYNPNAVKKISSLYQYINLTDANKEDDQTAFTDNSALKITLLEVLKSSHLSYKEFLALLDKANLLDYSAIEPQVLKQYLKRKKYLLKKAQENILKNKDVDKLTYFR
jgi:hypothetical protein